jgi:hypothetical protein
MLSESRGTVMGVSTYASVCRELDRQTRDVGLAITSESAEGRAHFLRESSEDKLEGARDQLIEWHDGQQ